MTLKEHSFLNDTIKVSFPYNWVVKNKENNIAKISFPFGPYPVLDCFFNCFDNPKINTVDKIKKYLLEGIKGNVDISLQNDDTYILRHKLKSHKENLLLWKIVSFLRPRSFREIRFAIAWPDNKQANTIVNEIEGSLDDIIKKIKFNRNKTLFDELGALEYKLVNSKKKKYTFWNALNIFFPSKWVLIEDKTNNFIDIKINQELSLLFEYYEIDIDSKNKNSDLIISNFVGEITKEVDIREKSLMKSEDGNYLLSFFSIENQGNFKMRNNIWYRLALRNDKLIMISFILSYNLKDELKGNIFFKNINYLIKSSEIN